MKNVIVRIEGGLGNQLFQYAAGRALADRLGCELALDLRGLALNADRPYHLNRYAVRAQLADATTLDSLPDWRAKRASRFRSWLMLQGWPVSEYVGFWPRSFAFDPRFEAIQQGVFLVGYWQSERYFSTHRARLLSDLQLTTPANPSLQAWLAQVRSCQSVALHVRRGDYVSNPAAAQFHGLCDLRYYEESMARLAAQYNDLQVFVFSDDLNWAQSHLKLNVPTHWVQGHSTEEPHLDLEIMRHCQHHILANSSFSWWGAWLCERSGQQVFAPKKWFADETVDTSDVIPARWHQL